MVTLDNIRKPIEDRMVEFEQFVRDSFSEKEGTLLAEMVEYIISSRGKGIRPTLTMLVAAATSPSGSFGKRTMLAALLIVNARWQSHKAVLVGDYLLAKNMDIGLRSGQYDLLTHIIINMATLCEGEILQSDRAEKLCIDKQSYFDIIYKKTASLIAACGSAGAMSVGASRKVVDSMHKFGEMVGMAFQIADDILDYTPSSNTGKPAYNDIRERKVTLPLIEVLERVSAERQAEILEAVKRAATDAEAVEFIHQQVVENGGVEAAKDTLQRFLQRGLSELSALEDSPCRQSLIDLCTFIAERDR